MLKGTPLLDTPRVHRTLKLVRPCVSVIVAVVLVDGAVVGRVMLVVYSFCWMLFL